MTQKLTFGQSCLPLPKASRPGFTAAARRPVARRRHALAWAACALLATPAAQALDIFTGNTPVYMGSWFNGTFVEVREFQFALDWAGWCNARVGANCSSHRYWRAAGNWDKRAVPGAFSDVRVVAGDTVRIGDFNSLYQGPLSGGAAAGTLSAAGRVELYGTLLVGSASFADLHNDSDNAGTLITTGLSRIDLLSSGAGRFQGVCGTTRVEAFAPSPVNGLFEPLVGGGHTLQFSGTSLTTGLAVRLQPEARFLNTGVLDMGGGSVGLQGTATFAQLPTFVNQGQLRGSGTVSGVKFENAGTVIVGSGKAMALGHWGEHSGRFSGDAGSTISFGGIGSAGHRFAADIDSLGAINFGLGNHRVMAGFNAASSSFNTGGTLTFEGGRPRIGRFELGGGGTVALRSPGGASINELVINGDFTFFVVETGAPLDLQRLQLLRGIFNVRAPVTLTSSVDWSTGGFFGNEPVTSTAAWRLLDGDRIFRGNVSSGGNLSWEGGRFTEWSGRFVNQARAQFDILGDFNSAGGAGGKLINTGTVSKRAGPGRSELAMVFDSVGGTARSLSGTLALTGGGTHTDATFAASAGAAIELAGGTTFGGVITARGPLHVTGGDFTLLPGTTYLHAAGNRFNVANVNIPGGAHLGVADAFSSTGNVINLGRFTPGNNVSIFGDFNQQGTFALNPGKALYVAGTFTHNGPLTVSDAALTVGKLLNHGTINVVGRTDVSVGDLDNRGTLVLGPANGFPGVIASISSGVNSGTLRVDGANSRVSAFDLQNTGVISNEGDWYAGGSFIQHSGGRFVNDGRLTLGGSTLLSSGTSIANSGTVTMASGLLSIPAGAQLSGSGQFVQDDGLTWVNGRLQAGGGINILSGELKGAGTVEGSVYVGLGGRWKLGNSPGTMTVLGNAFLDGTLEIEVESSTVHDRLQVLNGFTSRDTSVIDVVFSPGYRPQNRDFDSITWLSGPGGAQILSTVNFINLPSQWSATLAPYSGQIQLSNDLALQIPIRGSHTISAGAVHFNALGSASGGYPLLDRLDNAGYYHNRAGASAAVSLGELNNLAGATLLNRGDLYANRLNNAGQLNNRSGATLSARVLNNTGNLVNEGDLNLTNDLVNEAGAVLEQRGTMQVRGQVQNRGQLQVAGPMTGMYSFINNGDVHIQAGGSIEGSPGGRYWHSAGVLKVDGLLVADDIRVFGGNLSGNGRVHGSLSTNGPIGPGGSIGVLTVDGNLNAGGEINLEIASASDYDRLVVNGNATFRSGLRFQLLGDYRPTLGDSFSALAVSGASSYLGSWRIERETGFGEWRLWADANGIYDAAVPADWRASFSNGTLSITAVPEPGTWALLMAGLGVVAWVALRRQRHPDR